MLTFGKSKPSEFFTDVQHEESNVGANKKKNELKPLQYLIFYCHTNLKMIY